MEPFWSTKFRGTPLRISLADLTAQRLRQMKAWFGEAYGIPTEFISLLLRGEVDAMACAVWIGLQKAGKPVEHPAEIDFNLESDFEKLEDPKPPAKGKGKGNPTPDESPTPDSASGASTSSTTDTSSTSPTSAD